MNNPQCQHKHNKSVVTVTIVYLADLHFCLKKEIDVDTRPILNPTTVYKWRALIITNVVIGDVAIFIFIAYLIFV